MNLRKTLAALVDVIVQEASKNDPFRHRLEVVLGREAAPSQTSVEEETYVRRKGGRRTSAILDPVEIARRSESELRERLLMLDIEQLRDIVAQYGMDPGKLVMKWKDANRVAERILELAMARSRKGDAFRSD